MVFVEIIEYCFFYKGIYLIFVYDEFWFCLIFFSNVGGSFKVGFFGFRRWFCFVKKSVGFFCGVKVGVTIFLSF